MKILTGQIARKQKALGFFICPLQVLPSLNMVFLIACKGVFLYGVQHS